MLQDNATEINSIKRTKGNDYKYIQHTQGPKLK